MLDEPLTTFTDYLLAAASLGLAIAVARGRNDGNRVSSWLWCAGLVAAATAAAIGGTYHGLASRVDSSTVRALWSATMFAMGVCAGLFAGAVHTADMTRAATRRWLAAGVMVTAAGAAVQQGALGTRLPLGPNPNYHLIQLAGLYCVYRSARTARDRSPDPHA